MGYNHLTSDQINEILLYYDEARVRKEHTTGAWHCMLLATLKEYGIHCKDNRDAERIAREILQFRIDGNLPEDNGFLLLCDEEELSL